MIVEKHSGFYAKIVVSVRLVLGIEFLINGLNWWIKLIDPYPSISDYLHTDPPPTFVGAMIKSGILFHVVKAVELSAGLALLSNCFVPLALVVSMPITLNVFMVDVLLSSHLRAHIMGSGALLMSTFLMVAYIRYYRPMLDFHTEFDTPHTIRGVAQGLQFIWLDPLSSNLGRRLMTLFGIVSLLIGLVMITWVSVMIAQHFYPALRT